MLDPVTNRYTEALFGVAKGAGALDAVRADVERLARELAQETAVFDARLPVEERRKRVVPLFDGMHQLTRNFVNLLFDKRREDVLRGLGAAFHRRLLEERGEAEGVVESARPLDSSELERLGRSIGSQLHKSVTLKNRVVPDLIGGVRVIVESRMVDSSLSGRLAGLRKAMLEAPLHGASASSGTGSSSSSSEN